MSDIISTIRTIEYEARVLGARKGHTAHTGDAEAREAIDRRLAVLKARKAILSAAETGPLTAEDIADLRATVDEVAL